MSPKNNSPMSPLRASVEGDEFVIRIGIARIGDDHKRHGIKVTNAPECAANMCRMMQCDNEVGATFLTDMLDAALDRMCNEGWLGVWRKSADAPDPYNVRGCPETWQ